MPDDLFRVGVQPGDGVVARYGDVALVVAPGSDTFTDALLRVAATPYDDPRSLVWRVAGLVTAHQSDVPAFALVVGSPRSRRVLVHGAARAVVDGVVVDAADVWTWCERAFGPHAIVTMSVAPGPVVATPRSDLRDGMLAGAGLVLEPTQPVAGAPGAPASPARPAPLRSAVGPGFAPLSPPDPRPAPTPAASPIVPPRPPSKQDITTAIAASPHETVHLTDRIATLQADDGSRVPLDRDYVFGRDPRQDPAVVRGSASPIRVEDGQQVISRVHTYVSVTAGQVTVRDAGSANGTYVAAPGDPGWTPIGPDPVPLPVGHSLRLGLRVYTHLPPEGAPAVHHV